MGTYTIDLAADQPRFITFPNQRIKKFKILRRTNTAGEFVYYDQVDPEEQIDLTPTDGDLNQNEAPAFYLDGVNSIVLATEPTEAWNFEIFWDEYTAWPTDTNASTWLTENADDVLIAQAIVGAAVGYMRDQRLATLWRGIRDEGLKTVQSADAELRQGARNYTMNYVQGKITAR
jgi:hypothetical protein